MKGDFTRVTFDPRQRFSRVLMQQGRVQLDADFNEHVDIMLHAHRTLAADLIGPHGGPRGNVGFAVSTGTTPRGNRTLFMGPGRYYVDGIPCEVEATPEGRGVSYFEQPDLVLDEEDDALPTAPFLLYLDVWERHVSAVEVPEIREVALGLTGPDTASRARVVWQARVAQEGPGGQPIPTTRDELEAMWDELVDSWQPARRGMLQARGRQATPDDEPCIISPEARFRGAANQLYRVEIHDVRRDGTTTFKWSRDNGSVVYPVRDFDLSTEGGTDMATVTLDHLGRDDRFALAVGDWVEAVDDGYALGGRNAPLWQVDQVDSLDRRVVLIREAADSAALDLDRHPLLRRWDQIATAGQRLDGGAVPVVEGRWIALEDGVEVRFEPRDAGAPPPYRPGDYWLVPARTVTGDVEWPGPVESPEPRPPHGVQHHFAPLALMVPDANQQVIGLRRQFSPLSVPLP